MATSNFAPVTFCDICSNAFYFDVKVAITEVDVDTYMITDKCQNYRLLSQNDKFLLLNDEQKFEAQPLNAMELRESDCRFNINIYKDSCQETPKRRAVMLSIIKDGKRMVACCSGNNEISAVEMELPHTIPETAHKALFYLKQLPAHNKFMFESSVYPSKFLGLEPDEDNPTLNKLVLRHKASDEVDESAELTLVK